MGIGIGWGMGMGIISMRTGIEDGNNILKALGMGWG